MLNRQTYFIREHVGFMKLSDTYDILDPETHEQLGIAQERPGTLVHLLRFVLMDKRTLPTKVFVYRGDNAEDESKLVFSLRRGITLFRSRVDIYDHKGLLVGWLKSKAFSLGGSFRVMNALGDEVAVLKGDWKGWNFRFMDKAEKEIGTVAKKWAGLGKELFTSADNYIVALNQKSTPDKAMLLLAAGLAVDTVYKEK